MEEQNKVSVWVGKSKSEKDLKNYMREHYDDDGEMRSAFTEDFQIEFYDTQFQEVLYQEDAPQEALEAFSYYEDFGKDLPPINLKMNNSFVFLYNFNYDGSIQQAHGLKFLGSFDYE